MNKPQNEVDGADHRSSANYSTLISFFLDFFKTDIFPIIVVLRKHSVITKHITREKSMTRKRYHENPYLQTFSSQVVEHLEHEGKPAVILTQTAFYPTSGGQPHDTGKLNDVAVLDVIETPEHELIHILEAPLTADTVQGQINWERRFDHMQQHTGQHLLSQVFLKLCDADTLSFHLSTEYSSVDIDVGDLDTETVKFVEAIANQVIYENRNVTAHSVNSDELALFPIRTPPIVENNIRIVEIEQFDYSPCGGTHCSRTGEIGQIKITKYENYKGGSRISFVCGNRALKDNQQKTDLLQELSGIMSCGEPELPHHVQKCLDDLKDMRREHKHLVQQVLDYESRALLSEREQVNNISILQKRFEARDPKALKILAMKVLEQSPATVVLFGGTQKGKASLLFLCSEGLPFDMGQLMKSACVLLNGRGGGKPTQAQGGGTKLEKLEEALQHARNSLH